VGIVQESPELRVCWIQQLDGAPPNVAPIEPGRKHSNFERLRFQDLQVVQEGRMIGAPKESEVLSLRERLHDAPSEHMSQSEAANTIVPSLTPPGCRPRVVQVISPFRTS
jgi:hypothetical protein